MLKVRPGLLVTLSTKIRGGVIRGREVLEHRTKQDGADYERAETEREILKPEEYAEAKSVARRARTLIEGACAWTAFGLICPTESEELLDQRIAEAQVLCDAYNEISTHSRVRFATMRGAIAEDAKEAIETVTEELKDLLFDLDAALKDGDLKEVRDLNRRTREMGKMLEQESEAKGQLDKAIKASRALARAIVKKVEKGGEELEAVLSDEKVAANLRPIAVARFAFGDKSVEIQEDDGEALSPIAAGRAALIEREK